jgi:hypothetical protein
VLTIPPLAGFIIVVHHSRPHRTPSTPLDSKLVDVRKINVGQCLRLISSRLLSYMRCLSYSERWGINWQQLALLASNFIETWKVSQKHECNFFWIKTKYVYLMSEAFRCVQVIFWEFECHYLYLISDAVQTSVPNDSW